ncbi:hypothetical protein [Streptomyces sp. PTD5-9]|uniref:hypothetical protein n=1 Tax=Streptomyces sp. PTD5-9 TaxID=3120150 RepID=UPI003FCC2993
MTESVLGMVGTEDTRLIMIRGNSASGKSSVAAGPREKFGRDLAIVGQDDLRRIVTTRATGTGRRACCPTPRRP